MSRPRVNGPRSLIITIAEAPVIGFVTFTRVPNGSFLCAAVRPSGRNAWPLAVPEPVLYWVAFIEPRGQLAWVGAARAALPKEVETSHKGIASMSLIDIVDLPLRLYRTIGAIGALPHEKRPPPERGKSQIINPDLPAVLFAA